MQNNFLYKCLTYFVEKYKLPAVAVAVTTVSELDSSVCLIGSGAVVAFSGTSSGKSSGTGASVVKAQYNIPPISKINSKFEGKGA